VCRNSVKWLYRTDVNFGWDSGFEIPEDQFFLDAEGKVRLILERGGRVTVTREYAWNGCSPKVCLFDFLFGTPDGVVHVRTGRPKTYFASMVHDALYQFLLVNSPITRRQADDAFYRLMAESDFAPRRLYWLFVRLFGWLVWQATSARRDWRGMSVSVQELM
jgi:hypothetical protein